MVARKKVSFSYKLMLLWGKLVYDQIRFCPSCPQHPHKVTSMMSSQWRIGILPALFVLFLTVVQTDGHNLGEHSLTYEDPAGEPSLPEITGPFDLEFQVRYSALVPLYQTLLEYYDSNNLETLYFGHRPADGSMSLVVNVNGAWNECYFAVAHGIPTVGTLHTIKMGLDSTGKASLFMDGILINECIGFPTPVNTPRIHSVGGGGTYSTLYSTVDEQFNGAILGLRVINLNSSSPMDKFKFMNYPGQPRTTAFVASFYARFDDISRSNQRVFDFGNGGGDSHITCGQESATTDFECTIYETAVTKYQAVAANSIVQGEFAFWHFGVDSDGKMWITKDGVRQVTLPTTIAMPNVFRKDLLFGKSDFVSSADLEGVVLGFRLDTGEYLESSV